MSIKNNGICRLCLEKKELSNSHIIPEFAYKYVYEETKGGRKISILKPSESKDLIITNNQKGYREYLLCSKCEGNFSKWEKYVKESFGKGLTNFKVENISNFYKIKRDYLNFRLFFMSILWRCGITNIDIFQINLGQKHLENLRKLLLSENVTDHNQYNYYIKQIIDINNLSKGLLYVRRLPKKVDGFTTYCYFICGYICYIFVGSENHKLSNDLKIISHKQDHTLMISLEKFNESNEIKQLSNLLNQK